MGNEVGAGSGSRLEPAAWLAVVLLSAVWAWWAWQEGAYFGTVLLPGVILLCAGAALLLLFGPIQGRVALSGPVRIALVALVALAAWAALSALWSPAPDIAIANGQRIATYALSFGLGLALCRLLGRRQMLSLVPLAVAAAVAGGITVGSLALGGTPRDLLDSDGTLEFPLGYRNAVAAFFAIALFPALGLASDRDRDWRLRAVAVATATLCIDLLLLAQSRASMPAMVAGLLAYTLLSPLRVRALSWLALALLPALAIVPPLTTLYSAAGDGLQGAVDEMHRAGMVAAFTVVASLALGAIAARFERVMPGLGSDSPRANRWVSGGLVGIGAIGAVAFVVAVGDPVDWVNDRAEEFRTASSPDLTERSSRFTLNAGSERYAAWKVAVDDAGEDPLIGSGGGGYRDSFLRKRESGDVYVRDAHSVELELLSELGIVGLTLFVIVMVAATTAILRSRRAGPAASGLAAIALASGTYWFVHTSVDWFWPYPAITAPVFALAGSAAIPGLLGAAPTRPRRWTGVLIAALGVLAITAIPPWLSQRYTDSAYASWRTDLAGAYDDLERAQGLNPLNDVPLLAEASIARAAGDRERALVALRDAAEVRPDEWATHYLLADLQAESNPSAARGEIRIALEQNPLERRVRKLAKRLGIEVPPLGSVTS